MFNRRVDVPGEQWTIDENSGCFELAVKLVVIVLITLGVGAGGGLLVAYAASSDIPGVFKVIEIAFAVIALIAIWIHSFLQVVRA